jgi:hypothetical protein
MRDRVKRMLGFVLVETIDGPPGSPHQTHLRAQGCNRGSATATGGRSPSFHSSRVADTSAMGTHFRRVCMTVAATPDT